MLDPLAIACSSTRSDIVRLEAWRNYEETQWLAAVRERGLPADAVPIEYRARIGATMRALACSQITQLKETS